VQAGEFEHHRHARGIVIRAWRVIYGVVMRADHEDAVGPPAAVSFRFDVRHLPALDLECLAPRMIAGPRELVVDVCGRALQRLVVPQVPRRTGDSEDMSLQRDGGGALVRCQFRRRCAMGCHGVLHKSLLSSCDVTAHVTTVEGTRIAYREAVLAGHGVGDADTTGPAFHVSLSEILRGTEMTVGDVCTRAVVTATPDETIADAAKRMRDHHVGTVVVVDGERRDRPAGILTDRDIVVSAIAQSPEKVASLLIGDVMTRDVITTRPATTLHSALSTMHSRGIRRLPVVSGDGRLEGLIAFDDILEVMSEELSELVGLVAREQKLERELRR